MRVSLAVRRPPTLLEQLLGRRRARMVRRRVGLLLVHSGASMLKPRTTWAPLLVLAVTAGAVFVVLG